MNLLEASNSMFKAEDLVKRYGKGSTSSEIHADSSDFSNFHSFVQQDPTDRESSSKNTYDVRKF